MVAMGFLYGCSQRPGLRRGIVRGLGLIALGCVLNLWRFTLPLALIDEISVADATAMQAELGAPLEALLTVDILRLAGLSLIIIAFLKPFLRDSRIVAALALAVFVVSPLLWRLGGGSITDPLWGLDEQVAFPLFPWLGYPLLGLAFAQATRRSNDERRLMGRAALIALFLGFLGGVVTLLGPAWSVISTLGDYFHSGLGIHLVVVGFVFLWLPGLWWIARRLRAGVTVRYLTSLSGHLTAVYVVQWVIIAMAAIVFGVVDLPSWAAALTVPPIVAASHFAALGWDRAKAAARGRPRPTSATAPPPSRQSPSRSRRSTSSSPSSVSGRPSVSADRASCAGRERRPPRQAPR